MRILLVEDDQRVGAFVSKGLREAGYAVDLAADGLDGLHTAQIGNYDLLILDIMLPGMDGLELIENLRRRKILAPILVLSARQSVDDRVAGLRKGGDDYLGKPFAFAELLARVQALLRRAGGTMNEPTTLTVGDMTLNLLTREVQREGQVIPLQNKEFELLEYLMRNSGMVVSKTMIIEHVWNYHFDPQTNIVEALMSRLREKVDKSFETKLIRTIRGGGYTLKP